MPYAFAMDDAYRRSLERALRHPQVRAMAEEARRIERDVLTPRRKRLRDDVLERRGYLVERLLEEPGLMGPREVAAAGGVEDGIEEGSGARAAQAALRRAAMRAVP